ncbi:MAG TPA: hypothetical protein VLV78_12730 [Thermoanaerobaculia bacterium]|nr:hypothetical protein [Thermoanaerobaculia bacterium]
MRLRVIAALLLAAAAANAQTTVEQPPPVSTVVVPVAGRVVGANDVHWHTDLELRNDQRSEVTVMLTMPTAPDANFLILPISPGAVIQLTDVAAALGLEYGLSPIVIQTNDRKSVSVRATAYGTRGTELFPPEPIAINYGSSYFPVRTLYDLSFSTVFRTNLGLVNLGEQTADFTLALQRIAGRNLAVTRISIPPNSLWHMSIQSAFPLITDGEHFAVVIETSGPQTYVYASVIENATTTARFVQASFGAPTDTTR